MQTIEENKLVDSAEFQLEFTGDNKVSVVDNPEHADYLKKNVCLPYFKEIYRVT